TCTIDVRAPLSVGKGGRLRGRSLFWIVGVLADGLHAFAGCARRRISPAKGTERRGPLVDLLVRLRVELHLQRVPGRKLLHGDHELDVAVRPALLDGEGMKLGQFLGGVILRVHPLSHGRLVLRKIRPSDSTAAAFYLTPGPVLRRAPRARGGE